MTVTVTVTVRVSNAAVVLVQVWFVPSGPNPQHFEAGEVVACRIKRLWLLVVVWLRIAAAAAAAAAAAEACKVRHGVE